MILKVLLLIIFFGSMVAIGLYSRKHATNVNDFVLGGRAVGPWLTAFAYGTSYFSAVIFIGYAGQFGWKYGMAATWVGLGNMFIGSLMAWELLGRRTRVMTQHLNSATMPDFFGKRFDSKNLKVAASVIIFIFLIPYTASLFNGLSRLFGMAFNIDYSICVIAMGVLTGIYVIAGGYMATAINDFIQGMIMSAVEKLSQIQDGTSNISGAFTSFLGPDPFNLICVVLLTSLGTWGLPQMVQKFYTIKSEKSIKTGTIVSTVFAFVVAGGCYFLGGFGRLFLTQAEVDQGGFDQIVPTMLSTLPDILIAITVILVLSASMSTLSSLVLTSSSTMTLDLIGHFKKDLQEKQKLLCMRVLVAVFVIVSMVIALLQYKSNVTFIAQLMGISWGALAGAFLAPFLYGLYWKRTSKAAVWFSFIFGTCFMIANMLVKPIFPAWMQSPINAGVVAMVAGIVLVPIVSLFTPAMDQTLVDGFFSCYEEKVSVPKRDAIESTEGRQTGQSIMDCPVSYVIQGSEWFL